MSASEVARLTQIAKALYADKCALEVKVADMEKACRECKIKPPEKCGSDGFLLRVGAVE